MRALLQRVSHASVTVDGQEIASIGRGLLMLAGVGRGDTASDIEWIADKTLKLRIFPDAAGDMNASLRDIDGELLVVSQFTLHACLKKGSRPSWSQAAAGAEAAPLFNALVDTLSARLGKAVPTGVFGADMQVGLVNDGPVTLWLDSRART